MLRWKLRHVERQGDVVRSEIQWKWCGIYLRCRPREKRSEPGLDLWPAAGAASGAVAGQGRACRLWRLPADTGFTLLEPMQGRLIRGHSCSARKALVCCDATLGERCGSEHGIQSARKLKDQCCERRCKAAVARAKRVLRRETATFPLPTSRKPSTSCSTTSRRSPVRPETLRANSTCHE